MVDLLGFLSVDHSVLLLAGELVDLMDVLLDDLRVDQLVRLLVHQWVVLLGFQLGDPKEEGLEFSWEHEKFQNLELSSGGQKVV